MSYIIKSGEGTIKNSGGTTLNSSTNYNVNKGSFNWVFIATKEGKVNIELEQKKAVVRIKSKLSDYYLDEFANKMQLSDNYTPRLLIVTGDVNEENHQSIFDFVTEINNSEFWNAQLTQIHFKNNNDVILIPRVGNQKINFGKLENTTEKLYNLYQFYKIAMPVKGWQTYSDINLKFNNQIVCTKNK